MPLELPTLLEISCPKFTSKPGPSDAGCQRNVLEAFHKLL